MNSNNQVITVVGACREVQVGYYNSADRVRYWGRFGAYWGGLWGLLFGSGLFLVPGFGPAVVGGSLVAYIVGALESVSIGGGLSGLGAGLYGLSLTQDSVLDYEADIRAGKFLLITPGSVDVVVRARARLGVSEQNRGQVG